MDPIPVLSQTKSFVQFVFGQRDQAKRTQINFSRQCLVVSQARSAVELIKGDQAAARETQIECLRFVARVVNSVPVVGHISGGLHYAVGDKAGGNQAMKAASRTTAVIAGGIGGLFIGGTLGSIGIGISAGVVMDSAITVLGTAFHWKHGRKFRTFGLVEPLSDPRNVGKWFDATCGVAIDGVTAIAAGKMAQKIFLRLVLFAGNKIYVWIRNSIVHVGVCILGSSNAISMDETGEESSDENSIEKTEEEKRKAEK